MATTTPTNAGALVVALDQIYVPGNVRSLDEAHVDALAGSIALQGLLVPVVLAPATDELTVEGWRYQLVAGFHRYAAVAKLGHRAIDATVRDGDRVESDRAVENIARKALNPYEEAVAVKAMLEKGLTEDGAAQALGWPKQRIAARVKLLELPEQAQQLTGQGVIPLAAVDQLRTIGQVSPKLLDVLVTHVATEDGGWVAGQLSSDPGRALSDALRHSDSKVFAAYLNTIGHYELERLRLGKKTEALLAEAEKLHKQIDRYAYGPPTIRFTDEDVDQARAAGVLIELDRTAAIITDRPLYRELCKQAIKRTVQDLGAKAAEVAEKRKVTKSTAKPVDPEAEARRERGRQLRQLAEQAHGANVDLGWALMNNLAVVDAASDMNVARFFVYAVLGADYDQSPYTSTGDRVAELAVRGIRLVIEEFRSDVTKTRKDGTRGALRIDYGDPRKPEKAIAWLWRFVDAARTPGELFWSSRPRST